MCERVRGCGALGVGRYSEKRTVMKGKIRKITGKIAEIMTRLHVYEYLCSTYSSTHRFEVPFRFVVDCAPLSSGPRMSGRLALTQLGDLYFTTHGSALEEALSTSVTECMNARPDDAGIVQWALRQTSMEEVRRASRHGPVARHCA